MKAKAIAGGLLLVLYLLWLAATAPARLLTPMLPPGVQVGHLSGSVWRGEAQPIYWHGERLERLAWSLTLAGWQIALSDPRGVEGQARLWGLRELSLQEGRLTAPASLLSRWLMPTMPVSADGKSPSPSPKGGSVTGAVGKLPPVARCGGRPDCTPRSAAWSWLRLMAPSAARQTAPWR